MAVSEEFEPALVLLKGHMDLVGKALTKEICAFVNVLYRSSSYRYSTGILPTLMAAQLLITNTLCLW